MKNILFIPMCSTIPLFDQLYQQSEDTISSEELHQLCKRIKCLDEEGHELIFVLILSYYRKIEQTNDSNIPYSPKIGKVGYRFDTVHLPARLLVMINQFSKLHLNKMQDEKIRYDL